MDIDKYRYPLIIIRSKDYNCTPKELENDLDELRVVLKDSDNVILICDLSQIKSLSAENKIRIGFWSRRNAQLIKKHVIAAPIVVPSLLGKLIINSIFYIQRPTIPFKLFSTFEEAIEWGNEKLLEYQEPFYEKDEIES